MTVLAKILPYILGGSVVLFLYNLWAHYKAAVLKSQIDEIEMKEQSIDEKYNKMSNQELLDHINSFYNKSPNSKPGTSNDPKSN